MNGLVVIPLLVIGTVTLAIVMVHIDSRDFRIARREWERTCCHCGHMSMRGVSGWLGFEGWVHQRDICQPEREFIYEIEA